MACVACAPVEVQPDELLLAFQMQRQATFDAVPLNPRSCSGPGVKLCTYRRRLHYGAADFLVLQISLLILGRPHERCNVAEKNELLQGVSCAANWARAPHASASPQACMQVLCYSSFGHMRGTCTFGALLLQI